MVDNDCISVSSDGVVSEGVVSGGGTAGSVTPGVDVWGMRSNKRRRLTPMPPAISNLLCMRCLFTPRFWQYYTISVVNCDLLFFTEIHAREVKFTVAIFGQYDDFVHGRELHQCGIEG